MNGIDDYQEAAFAPYYAGFGQVQALLDLNASVGELNRSFGNARKEMNPWRLPRSCVETCRFGEPGVSDTERRFRTALRLHLRKALRAVSQLASFHGIGLNELATEDRKFMLEEGKERQ